MGDLRPDLQTEVPGPESRALVQRLRTVESRNVTYPASAVFWDSAQGSNVVDVDGNRFVDVTGAFGVAALGHSHPATVEVVRAQAERLLHGMGDIHPSAPKVGLLERLGRLTPWDETRGILGSSGSESVEAALKTAHVASGRPGVLAFEGAYHGLTLGALGTTHRDHFRRPFTDRLREHVIFAPFPSTPAQAGVSLDAVEAALVDPLKRIGAVLVEPMQGRAGCRIPPPGFLRGVAERVRAAGALLITDEIYTGLGRCGRWFAAERDGCEPDLICVGKALGGGMPVSACLGRADVMDAWPETSGEAIHTSTFLGHPASAAAACAVLDTLEREALVERSDVIGRRLEDRLRAALTGSERVADVRGWGMLLGVELTPVGMEILNGGAGLCHTLLTRGVIALPAGERGQVLQLAPALTISEGLADYVVDLITEAILA